MIDKKLEKDIDIAIELLIELKENYTNRALQYNSRQHNKEKVKRTSKHWFRSAWCNRVIIE